MPTNWQTFPVEFRGGLITNISPLQQGLNSMGSARELRNFEPSIEGGYRRVQGYTKYNDLVVPSYGAAKIQGASNTGTTINLASVMTSPVVGDKFTISGDTTVYTISSIASDGFNVTNKTLTCVITPTLSSTPADKASVTFVNNTNLIDAVAYYASEVIAVRDGTYWSNDTDGAWTLISKPSYGVVLVNGASQTGTTLAADGLVGTPNSGDTFTIAGVAKVYTVVSEATVNASGESTLVITPALATSPANNAVITWLQTSRESSNKVRYDRYNLSGTPSITFVDGANYPVKYDGTTFKVLNEAPTDLIGADFVTLFKSQLFFAKDNQIIFSAPYTDDDFTAAAGSGTIALEENVTGLIAYREQLIIFTRRKIYRVTGNTIADFVLQPITLDIGCVSPDTVQEVGGDVMFMAPDGLRLLSATDRIGDFGLSTASKPIQDVMTSFTSSHTSFAACVIRRKSQYRVFGYSPGVSANSARGILGTQFADQTSEGMAWSRLRGFKVYAVDSYYDDLEEELVVFSNDNGYVYRMESGSSLDGDNIRATFSTPHFSLNDPRLRKTMYKLTTYVDPRGSVSGTASAKFDFDQPNTPEPAPVSFSNGATSTAAFYGETTYGTATFGGKLVNVFTNQIVGAGNSVSIQFVFDGTDPEFSLDAILLEFATNDRQ
mgnify:CR=1 FL=1|tara:strand:+ start:2312 stop:4300 length:1989 start_codon:yes stop_codon:yes gene_type:complete